MTDPPNRPLAGHAQNSVEDPAVIYPLIDDPGNKRVLWEWLEANDDYVVADNEPLNEATFDICLVDQPALFEYNELIKEAKTAAEPALLPVLLLVSDLDTDHIDTEQGELADNVFATTVDELISLPIRKTELEWQLNTLCRLRIQSLNLKARTERLRKFQKAVEASGHGIMITDADGNIQYVNPAFETITGYSGSEAIGDTPTLLNSGEMSESFYDELWETITAGETWHGEIVDRSKNGDIYIADQTIAPIHNESGDITAYVAVQTDVTDQKQLESRLKRHRNIVQRLEDPIMLQDTDDQFVLVNDALCEFAGLSAEELEGTDEYAFMDNSTAQVIDRQKQSVRWTEQPVTYSISPTFEYSRKEAVFYTTRYPYYDENGELAGTLAICRDVTDLDERTRQLHVLDNILRHNIRNSLNVIYGQGARLQSAVDGELEEAAESIIKTAHDLLTTSEKSREITRVLSEDTGTRCVDLAENLDRIVATVADEWPEVDLSVSIPNELVVTAHPAIDSTFEELIANAVAHNDHENLRVEVTTSIDDGKARIQVADNGPGISEFDREVLEAGTAVGTLSHGSGLGLWLVYWIVKRSNGAVTITDRDSAGTAVTVSLPIVSTSVDS